MTADEVIAKLREWEKRWIDVVSISMLTDMADAVQTLKDECERLKNERDDLRQMLDLANRDLARLNDFDLAAAKAQVEVKRLLAENAKLRKERVLYKEVPFSPTAVDATIYEVVYADGVSELCLGCDLINPENVRAVYRIDNLPPRTPENTVPLGKDSDLPDLLGMKGCLPLKKGPTVVERVARTIFSCANALGIGIAQHHREFIAEQLNAASLLREDGE